MPITRSSSTPVPQTQFRYNENLIALLFCSLTAKRIIQVHMGKTTVTNHANSNKGLRKKFCVIVAYHAGIVPFKKILVAFRQYVDSKGNPRGTH